MPFRSTTSNMFNMTESLTFLFQKEMWKWNWFGFDCGMSETSYAVPIILRQIISLTTSLWYSRMRMDIFDLVTEFETIKGVVKIPWGIYCATVPERWTPSDINDANHIIDYACRTTLSFRRLIVGSELQSLEQSSASHNIMKLRLTENSCKLCDFCKKVISVQNLNIFLPFSTNSDSMMVKFWDRSCMIQDRFDIYLGDSGYLKAFYNKFSCEKCNYLATWFFRLLLPEMNSNLTCIIKSHRTAREPTESPWDDWLEQFQRESCRIHQPRVVGYVFIEMSNHLCPSPVSRKERNRIYTSDSSFLRLPCQMVQVQVDHILLHKNAKREYW
jgi:hypothetical protein